VLDHLIPLWQGGSDDRSNLQVLHENLRNADQGVQKHEQDRSVADAQPGRLSGTASRAWSCPSEKVGMIVFGTQGISKYLVMSSGM
jgi:hypothetical protein